MLRAIFGLSLAIGLAVTLPVRAQSLKDNEVLSSMVLTPVATPQPVLGADGRVHLAYELLATNPGGLIVTIDKLEALAPDGTVVETLDGQHLREMVKGFAGGHEVLEPGGSAVVFLDVNFAADEKLPQTLSTRITASRQQLGADGKPQPMPTDSPAPTHYAFTTAPFAVGQTPAITIEPPLRGKNWAAVSGCCDTITAHRGAVLAVNGRLVAPERFAIDWVQLDAAHKIVSGDLHDLKNYKFFGVPVYAVADGTVVNWYNAEPEQIPGQAPKNIVPAGIGGNLLVIDIGGGHFAFYGHLQPGSLKVQLGEHVHTGEVIGLLGNTGNSTGPHLHFHIMDGPSPLNASGLPYVITHFEGEGFISPGDEDALEEGKAATIDPSRLAGSHTGQLPLNGELVDFN